MHNLPGLIIMGNGIPMAVIFVLLLFSCSNNQIMTVQALNVPLTYLALGDSYTIGESVMTFDRFPHVIAERLRLDEKPCEQPKIIAKTGWTTDELISAIDQADLTRNWDLVSLLIGVNNQYRGYSFEQYEREFNNLLTQAVAFAGGRSDRVFVVSIPDYAFTPFGQRGDSDKISREVSAYNAYAKGICAEQNILFLDITPLTQEGLNMPEFVAQDELHPSGLMYRKWIDLYYLQIKNLLDK